MPDTTQDLDFLQAHLYDWTMDELSMRTNSSEKFIELVARITYIIRGSAHDLLNGRVDRVALTIMARLAHDYGLVPARMHINFTDDESTETPVSGIIDWNGKRLDFTMHQPDLPGV